MGTAKSKVRVIPLTMVDENDPNYYVGEVKKKKKNGEIIFIRSGSGKQTWNDKSMYLGNFKEDEMNGNGTITYPNGSIYSGNWLNGVRHGKGKLISTEGSSYDGEWRYDVWDGNGRLTYDNGDYVVGHFKLDTICGKAKMYNSHKQKIYDGDWLNDQFHGKGTYFFTNGKVQFKGNWCQSLAHGIGIQYDEDGAISHFGVYEDGYFIKDLVQDIYFVLQCHIENQEYFYSVDSSNNLVLEQDVIDWVNREYQSPHQKPIGNGDGHGDGHGDDSNDDYRSYTPPIRSNIQDVMTPPSNNDVTSHSHSHSISGSGPLDFTQFNVTKESYANLSTGESNDKKKIIKNPLMTVKQTNPFLFTQQTKHSDLPKVAQDIIQKSIETNTFNHSVSPPAVPVSSYNNAKKNVDSKSNVGNKNKNGLFSSLFSSKSNKKTIPVDADTNVRDNPLARINSVVRPNPAYGRVMLNGDEHSLIQKSSSKNIQQLIEKYSKKEGKTRKKNFVPQLDLTSVKEKRKFFSRKKNKNVFPQQTIQTDNPANIVNGTKGIRFKKRELGGAKKTITKYIAKGNGVVNPVNLGNGDGVVGTDGVGNGVGVGVGDRDSETSDNKGNSVLLKELITK